MNAAFVCHVIPDVGRVVDAFVVIVYCGDWPVLGVRVTTPTVIPVCVGVPLTAGTLTAAPSPLATALATTVPVGIMAGVWTVTCEDGMLTGRVIVLVLALYAVGLPETATVTTVLFVRTAAATISPGGRFDTVKLDGDMGLANVPLVRLKVMLALTGTPTFSPVNPEDCTLMASAAAVEIDETLRTAVPSL